MEQVILELERLGSWKEMMRSSCKANRLRTSLANELTLLKLKCLNDKLAKSYQNLQERVGTVWIENELKTFYWLLLAISGLRDLGINEFGESEWTLLQSIFLHKSRSFLKFQAKKLLFTKSKNQHWSEQESQLLKKLIDEMSLNQATAHQWNTIARKMFELSEETIFRTGKHCRERWLNYLDPSKQRGQWTVQEDVYLLTRVYEDGKKWSEYAAYLKRTEHTVKNHFNSLIIKQKRATPHIKKEEKLIAEIKSKLSSQNKEEHQGEEGDEGSSGSEGPVLKGEREAELNSKKEQRESNQGDTIRNHQINQVIFDNRILDQQVKLVSEGNEEHEESGREDMDDDKGRQFLGQEINQANQANQANQVNQGNSQELQLLRYTRQHEQIKNLPTANQFGVFSPFWTYSPSNGTPNNFMSSPSPLPFYINSNFANYFNRFTTQLRNLPQHEDNQNQNQ